MGPSIERSITRPERRPTAGLRETRQGGLTQSTSARGETLTFHRDDICFSLVSETMQQIQVSRAAGRIFQQSSDLCKMRISFFVIFFLRVCLGRRGIESTLCPRNGVKGENCEENSGSFLMQFSSL